MEAISIQATKYISNTGNDKKKSKRSVTLVSAGWHLKTAQSPDCNSENGGVVLMIPCLERLLISTVKSFKEYFFPHHVMILFGRMA